MIFTSILFYFFSTCLVFSSSMVVIFIHPVFSTLLLAASFILTAFLFFLLECEFLALLFLVIYLGAVIVLFLFAVMMLESKINTLSKKKIKYVPVGFVFTILLVVPLFTNSDLNFKNNFTSSHSYENIYQNWYGLIDSTTDVQTYGHVLYSYYILQFLISGLILMLVLIGVVYLTNTFVKQQTNNQSIFKQLSRSTKFF